MIAAVVARAVEAERIYVIPLEAVLYQLDIVVDDVQPLPAGARADQCGTDGNDAEGEDERDDEGVFFAPANPPGFVRA